MDPVQHKLSFRPRARLVSILGAQMISDQAVGLIELVKNAYDADGTEVEIQLLDLVGQASAVVVVRDNGSGMTLDDVTRKWLSPGVDHKEQAKVAHQPSPLGRLPIGEKGVGRFAVHQIGRRLELVTRAIGTREIAVAVDWDAFDEPDAELESLKVPVVERDPVVFLGSATGTLLRMSGARVPWTPKLLEKVQRTLRRLQSPKEIASPTPFRISLKCPENPDVERIDPSDLLDHAHYEFKVLVEPDGHCDYEYVCRHPARAPREKTGTADLGALAKEELQGAKSQCGPFWINLYVWDRTRDYLAKSGVSKDDLDAQCGVSLYRDHLRVLPYGEPGDDWLFLDRDRIQDPSGRIGNNQVVGLVQILQETNLLLRDKTNREGLIENEAFLDLRALTRAAMRVFQPLWKSDRPVDDRDARRRGGTLGEARTVAIALRDTVRDDVLVPVPGPRVAPESPAAAKDSSNVPSTGFPGRESRDDAVTDVPPAPATVIHVSQRQAVAMIIDSLAGAAAAEREREQRIDQLLHLAATGMAAERVVHEFGRQVSHALAAVSDLQSASRGNGRAAASLSVLQTCIDTLRNEFRVLAPYEAVERSERTRDVEVRDCAELALVLNHEALEREGITASVEGESFRVRARPAALVQVLDNLVHNACWWLAQRPRENGRRLRLLIDRGRRKVLVADSGPGIHEEAQDHVFEPFFTMRGGSGRGLGLYISSEIMKRMHGALRLARDDERTTVSEWATGAVLVVDFPAANDGTV